MRSLSGIPNHQPPDVAILFYSLECGGVERNIVCLTQHLTQRGLKVDLLLRHVQGQYLTQIPPEVRIIDLGQGYLKNISRLVAYLRQEQPVNLLSRMYPHNEMAIIARFFAKSSTQIIVCIHSMLSGQQHIVQFRWPVLSKIHTPLVKFMAFCLYRWADKVLAVSRGSASDLAQVTGIPLAKIKVVYNPVIGSQLQKKSLEPINHPWFIKNQTPVIVAVGRLHKIKDFSTLIRALALVHQVRPAKLLILGEGPEEKRLQALVDELGLSNDVCLAGFVINPYPYIRHSSVLVLSSLFEALPAVLIEALALQTPVVATNCPSGPSEILKDGKYGELVPVGDSAAMAAAILHVLAGEIKVVDESWLEQFNTATAMKSYIELLETA